MNDAKADPSGVYAVTTGRSDVVTTGGRAVATTGGRAVGTSGVCTRNTLLRITLSFVWSRGTLYQ